MNDLAWSEVRQRVPERANSCCEYCQTCEVNSGQTMQVDHIDPDGGDDLDNLCLACWNCNNHKRQATIIPDPETGEDVPWFNPRRQIWSAHFEWINDATYVRGLTPTGRATVVRLKMNRPAIVVARSRWVEGGCHPPACDK
jgi:hypothetical protein